MTTIRTTIKKPVDPLSAAIEASRSAYARKWRLPVPERTKPATEETDPCSEGRFARAIGHLLRGK
jgi:hypothetical protein